MYSHGSTGLVDMLLTSDLCSSRVSGVGAPDRLVQLCNRFPRDDGKENGNYYNGLCRVWGLGLMGFRDVWGLMKS